MGKKLGYMALLRNLRNIFTSIKDLETEETQESCADAVFEQLVDEYAIKKSLVFPYQIYSSYKALADSGINRFDLMEALSKAFRISTNNMPKLNGENVIMLDVSGSMDNRISGKSTITIKEAGAVYAAAIFMANKDTKIIKFGTSARIAKVNLNSNVFDMVKQIAANDNLGYGTDISKAFEKLRYSCDRIFLISDMQIMEPADHWYYAECDGRESYNEYVGWYGRCKMYSFDLGNYSTQVANPMDGDVSLFTSLSSKVFDFIKLKEDNIDIIDYINSNYAY